MRGKLGSPVPVRLYAREQVNTEIRISTQTTFQSFQPTLKLASQCTQEVSCKSTQEGKTLMPAFYFLLEQGSLFIRRTLISMCGGFMRTRILTAPTASVLAASARATAECLRRYGPLKGRRRRRRRHKRRRHPKEANQCCSSQETDDWLPSREGGWCRG